MCSCYYLHVENTYEGANATTGVGDCNRHTQGFPVSRVVSAKCCHKGAGKLKVIKKEAQKFRIIDLNAKSICT